MTQNENASSGPARAEATRFLRYCLVGAVGFMADATVLLALVHGAAMNPLLARAFSFSLAMILTFTLNRHWTFEGRTKQGPIASFLVYLSVQGLGFICNAAIYAITILTLPPPFSTPLFSLAIASTVALAVNYGGARQVVFSAHSNDATRAKR